MLEESRGFAGGLGPFHSEEIKKTVSVEFKVL